MYPILLTKKIHRKIYERAFSELQTGFSTTSTHWSCLDWFVSFAKFRWLNLTWPILIGVFPGCVYSSKIFTRRYIFLISGPAKSIPFYDEGIPSIKLVESNISNYLQNFSFLSVVESKLTTNCSLQLIYGIIFSSRDVRRADSLRITRLSESSTRACGCLKIKRA